MVSVFHHRWATNITTTASLSTRAARVLLDTLDAFVRTTLTHALITDNLVLRV